MIQTPLVLLFRPFALPAPPAPGLGVPCRLPCRPSPSRPSSEDDASILLFPLLASLLAAVKPFHGFPSHLCSALPHAPFRELSLSARAPINDSPASPSPSKFKRTPHARSRPTVAPTATIACLPPPLSRTPARDSVLSRLL